MALKCPCYLTQASLLFYQKFQRKRAIFLFTSLLKPHTSAPSSFGKDMKQLYSPAFRTSGLISYTEYALIKETSHVINI